MNGQNSSRLTQVLAAVGKSAAYLVLFLGSQTLVSSAYVFAAAVVLTGGGQDMDSILDYVYGKTSEITLISGLLTLAVLAVFYLVRRKKLSQALTIHRVPAEKLLSAVGLAPALYLAVIVVLSLLPEAWLTGYEEASASLNDTGLVAFVSTVVVAPLAEEIVFRGLIQNRLSRAMPGWLAVVLTAAVFGLCHGEPVWMAYAFALGAAFGVVAWRCGSILPTIVMHVIFNGIGQIGTMLPDTEDASMWFMAAILALALLGGAASRGGTMALLYGGRANGPETEENTHGEDGL